MRKLEHGNKRNLKRKTESLLIATHNNAIRTNYVEGRISKTQQNSRCSLCSDRDETINHIISECSKLAQNNAIRVNWAIGLMSRVFANGSGDRGSIPSQVIPKTQKMVLDTAFLNTQHYKVRIKGKVEQSRKWSRALHYTSV